MRMATPPAPMEAVPRRVEPSSKSTVPPGALPFPLTCAVSVSGVPAANGDPAVERTVIVPLNCTVSISTALVLAWFWLSPE